jgi:hypothetical protein
MVSARDMADSEDNIRGRYVWLARCLQRYYATQWRALIALSSSVIRQ